MILPKFSSDISNTPCLHNRNVVQIVYIKPDYIVDMSDNEKQFETLGLKSWLVQQCKGLGMKQPTLVQSNCVPAILEGNLGVLL